MWKYSVKKKKDWIFKKIYFKLFSPLTQIQSVAHSEPSNKFYAAISAHLALLAHVASHNTRAVSDTFKRRNVPPPHLQPPSNPNLNENRSHNSMLGTLRSPPPAANWNRSSSTALCTACVYVVMTTYQMFTVSCIACMNMKSGLLHSRS